MVSLKQNDIFTVQPVTSVPAGHKTIGSRWMYKVKADNSRKERLVVLGWGPLPSTDCDNTFDSVCIFQKIHMGLTIAAEYNLKCLKLHHNTAFLNANVTEQVYVTMTPGYEPFDKNGVPPLTRLSKSLYGLRHSPTN